MVADFHVHYFQKLPFNIYKKYKKNITWQKQRQLWEKNQLHFLHFASRAFKIWKKHLITEIEKQLKWDCWWAELGRHKLVLQFQTQCKRNHQITQAPLSLSAISCMIWTSISTLCWLYFSLIAGNDELGLSRHKWWSAFTQSNNSEAWYRVYFAKFESWWFEQVLKNDQRWANQHVFYAYPWSSIRKQNELR